MDRIPLHAKEREILGKKVKKLRKDGNLPAHVFGRGVDGENVLVSQKDFLKVLHTTGETGLVDLKIGARKVRPVLIREVQYDPITEAPIHIDFYQVNLSQKVKVSVPLVQIGEQPEVVKLGEAIVLQTINDVEVEALPTDLVEKIEVDISTLKAIDDAITIGGLNYDKTKLTISAAEDEIVVKLAPAVSAEMEKLLEEQAQEQAAAAAEVGAEGEAVEEGVAEGKEDKEGEAPTGEEAASAESSGEPKEEKPQG